MKQVQIQVRSPLLATPDDYSVHVGLEQTIADLKQAIGATHHASPLPRDMRIIWRGRMLLDSEWVSCLFADEEASESQTVHLVLNSPSTMTVPLSERPADRRAQRIPPKLPASQAACPDNALAASTEHIPEPSMPSGAPSVLPLGSQFQYVLLNGLPYLMVLQPSIGAPLATAQQQQQQQVAAALVGEASSEMQTLGRLNTHLELRNRMLQELEETSERLARLMALNRTRGANGAGQQRPAVAAPDPRARRPAHANPNNRAPLANVLRNLNFSAIWSVGWMLLRMLLLVVVFAHDASLDRMLALAIVVACIFALRTAWVQDHVQWLHQHNNYIDANVSDEGVSDSPASSPARRHHHQFTAWEKARALVVALFTSLVPVEPFQAPAIEEEQ